MKSALCLVFWSVFLFLNPVAADIEYNHPTQRPLYDEIESFTLSGLTNRAEQGDGRSEFLLGFLLLGGDNILEVEPDYDRAFTYLKRAWDAGVVDAGYYLANMYYTGRGVDKDYEEVRMYLESSAEGGYILSQRMLGKSYLKMGVPDLYDMDLEKAVYWLSEAGEQGDAQASAMLSSLYLRENLGEDSEELAFYWGEKAANPELENFRLSSHLDLAELYEEGVGTSVDLVQAYKYYDLSGTAGSEGKARLDRRMTQDQIHEALRQSRTWQEQYNTFVPGYYGLEHQSDGSYQ